MAVNPISNPEDAALLKALSRRLRTDRGRVDVKKARRIYKRRLARGDTVIISLLAAVSASRVSAAAKETEDVTALPVANSLEDLLAVGEMCIPGLNYNEAVGDSDDHADHERSFFAYVDHDDHGAAHHGGRFASRLADKYRRDHDAHDRHEQHEVHDGAGHSSQHASHGGASNTGHQGHGSHQQHGAHHASHTGDEDNASHAGRSHDSHDVAAHDALGQPHAEHEARGAEHNGHANAHASHGGAHHQHATTAQQGGHEHHNVHSVAGVEVAADVSEQSVSVAHADHHEGMNGDHDAVHEEAESLLASLGSEMPEDAPQSEGASHAHHDHHDEAALAMMDAAPAEDLAALSQPII